MFELIKNIELKNNYWKDKIFITSDIDWASDEVLEFSIDLIEKFNSKCTFFSTHQTKILNQVSSNIAIGIHPNYNFLLYGDNRYGNNYEEVLNYYHNMFPNAKSIRSQSLTDSTFIKDKVETSGFTHEVNTFIPFNFNSILFPFKSYNNNLTRVPYIWEDDVHCLYNLKYDVSGIYNYQGIRVLYFHPIHIFLNTENLERYNSARPYLQDYKELKKFINTTSYGTKDFLIDLIKGNN